MKLTRGLMVGVLLAAVSLVGCASTGLMSGDGMMVHIKSGVDEPHSVLMGLQMARIMAKDHPVLVYFDVAGIGVVTKDAPVLKMEPFGASDQMLADLLALNVPVMACPGCIKAAGKTPADLKPGIAVADKAAFFNFAGGRIITLDY